MKSVFVILISLLFSLNVFAADNKVSVLVTLSPAGSFQAVSSKLKGNVVKKEGGFSASKITVSIESFKTGIDLRDEHFWKHLNPSKKHERAILTDLKTSGNKGQCNLEVNGVKKNIVFNFTEKDGMIFTKFNLKASDFKLSKASYMGVGVEDTVTVEVSMKFKAK